MSRTRRATIGFATSLVQVGAQLGTAALLSPLVLHYEGQRTLGAFGVLMQAVSYLWLLDFGFGVALGRSLSQTAGRAETAVEFRRSAGTGLAFYAVSNACVALGAIVVAVYADRVLAIDATMLQPTRVALCLLAAWALIRTPLAIYGPALIAVQELGRSNLSITAGSVVRLGLSVLAIANGGGLIGLVVAHIASEATGAVLQRYFYLRQPGREPVRSADAHWPTFTAMFGFGSQYLLASITTRLVYSTDQLIVAHQGGLEAAAIYYTTQMPTFVLIQVVWKLADSAAPAVNELYARAERTRLVSSLLRIGRYSLIAGCGAALGILLFNREVVTRWVGAGQYAGRLMTVSLAVFAVLSILNHVFWLVLVTYGRMRLMSIAGFVLGVSNVTLSFALGSRYGLAGVAMASAIAEGIGLAVYLVYVMRLLELQPRVVAREALMPALAACACVMPVLLWRIAPFGAPPPAPVLLVAFCLLFSLGAWRFGLLPEEQAAVRRVLRTGVARG